jgi:hypothetical protein
MTGNSPQPAPNSGGGATNPARSDISAFPEQITSKFVGSLTQAQWDLLTPEQKAKVIEANLKRYQ